MKQTRLVSIPVLAAVALGAAAASALADGSVDLQLRGKDKVAGTLRPVSDTECYVCDLPRGSVLSVALKGAGKPFPTVGLALRLDGADVAGAPIVTNTKGATLKSYGVVQSGRYTVCVVGSGGVDGDYSAAVSWKPKSTWIGTGGPLPQGLTTTYSFSAPAGASATIDVVPSPGSAFQAALSSVTGPEGFDAGEVSGTHATIPVCPTTGDYFVKFENAGAEGNWTARVKLKLPRVSKGKVDLRDKALTGAYGADNTVYGRLVDEGGGVVTVGDENFSALAGSSVSVPADALGSPTVITISATTTVYPEGGSQPAGPAVEFGPEGTTFSENATLTLPYDPAFFPDGIESLEVYVRDAEGNVTLVAGPYTIDEVNHLVSFPVSHFSSYQAAASGPRRFVGSYYVIELSHETYQSFDAKFGFGLHQLTTDGKLAQVSLNNARISWQNFGVEGSNAGLETSFDYVQLDVATPNESTVVLSDPQKPGEGATFTRGTSDDVLVGESQTLVALRRAARFPTISSAAGRYHVFHMEATGQTQNTGGPSYGQIAVFGETGEVTLRPDGTVGTTDFRALQARTDFPMGTWEYETESGPPGGITWGIGDGNIYIAPPEGEGSGFSLYAALDGDVLIGQPSSYGETESSRTELFIFVRASAGKRLSEFAGLYSVCGEELTFEDRASPPGQGITFQDYSLTSTVTGAGNTSIAGLVDIYGHDTDGNPESIADVSTSGDTGRLTLYPDGLFTLPHGIRGAVSASGAFAVQVHFDRGSYSMYFATPAIEIRTK